MTKKLYTEASIQDIADAIREKNGSSDTYTVSEMGDAVRAISGGGEITVTNGVLESLVAKSGTISASTFVQVETSPIAGTGTELSDRQNSATYREAVYISETSFLLLYNSSDYASLYGRVCSVSGTTITPGTETLISSSFAGSLTAVYTNYTTNRTVFIAFAGGSSQTLYGVVCSVSGTTITVGTEQELLSQSYSGSYASATLMEANKVFIAHRGGSYLNGVVCTISGTTITVGTDTQLSTVANSYMGASAAAQGNYIFIAHRRGTYLYGMWYLTTTGTVYSDVPLTSYYQSYLSSKVVQDTKLFVVS